MSLIIQNNLGFNGIFSVICCGILGLMVWVVVCQKMSQEDKVEELDERNQIIELKSKRFFIHGG